MSAILGAGIGSTSVGLDLAISNASLVRQRIDQLTAQTASGHISTDFAGLGTGARAALDLSTQIAGNIAIQTNADSAATISQVAQTALGQIEQLASSFAAQATSLETLPNSADTVAATARGALAQVAALLNTKVGDIYVFGGQNSRTPPVPNPSQITQSSFFTAINTAVAGLATNGAAVVSSQTLAASAPGATSPFAPSLEASNLPASVDLGGGQRVQVGVLADRNTDAVSAGAGTLSTGSYTRDILRGLATLGSLTGAQGADPQFVPLVQNTVSGLQGAIGAINTDIGGLGGRQNQITAAKTELADTNTALSGQFGSVQDVNLLDVATQLARAQTQLQASYQVIAAVGQLSLSKYLQI